MKTMMFVVLLVMISLPAQAETIHGKVFRIYPNGDTINFRLIGDTCNQGSEYYQFTYTDHADSDSNEIKRAWFAMLLAAFNTGKEVRVRVTNCEPGHKKVVYLYQEAG